LTWKHPPPDNVLRTRKPIFDVPGQIAAVKNLKLPNVSKMPMLLALSLVSSAFDSKFSPHGRICGVLDCSPTTMPPAATTRTLSIGEFFGDLGNLISSPGFRVIEPPPVVCLYAS
jgi:hypothetical protein